MEKSHFSFIASLFMLFVFTSCTNSAKPRLLDANIAKLSGVQFMAVAVSFCKKSPGYLQLSSDYNKVFKKYGEFPSFPLSFILNNSCNCINGFQFGDGCNQKSSSCIVLNDTIILQFGLATGTKKECDDYRILPGYASLLDTCIYRFRSDTLLLISKTADTVFFVKNQKK